MDKSWANSWLEGKLARATRPSQAAALIAVVTTVITVGAGLLMTVVDHQNFPSVGLGLWWAIQTVTTVGYGDYVPHNFVGRAVATLVMLGGIGLLTVVTAAITSGFVARAREDRSHRQETPPSAEVLQEILASLRRLEEGKSDR